MRCPVDGEELGLLPRVAGLASACEACGGLWLDSRALHALGGRVPRGRSSDDPSDPRTCPACELGMRRVTSNDLEVDLCATCAGVWLDAGELETLKAIHAARLREPPPREEPSASSGLGEAVDTAITVGGMVVNLVDLAATILSIFG